MLKRFLTDWVIPPAVLKQWRDLRRPTTQKFWSGAPLAPAPAEQAYFARHGLESRTFTRDDDSRSAGILRAAEVRLQVAGGNGNCVQLAIATDAWADADRLSVSSGGNTVEHTGLSTSQWLDLRLPLAAGESSIVVRCTRSAYVTVPRRVQSAAASVAPHHVLVIVLDGMTPYLRQDPAADPGQDPATPAINRFFDGGYVATNAWTTGEWTLPASSSLFTGLYTSRHRMWHPTAPQQMPDRATLATRLQEAGYHTLALSTANRLTPAYGSHRGFDRFIYHWPYPGHTARDYDPSRWCSEILSHLDLHRHDRSFVYAHFPDTHPSWNVPPLTRAFNFRRRGNSTGHDLDALREHPSAGEQGRMLNAARLQELDLLLGGIFDYIDRNLGGRALVALTADHGTPWAALRARRPADEPYLVDHRSRIELRMRGPGVPRRYTGELCSPTIDLMPTLLALCGLEAPADLDGRDLLAPGYRRDMAVTESLYGNAYEVAIRDHARTYIEKFPMDEVLGTVLGPAQYRKCFPRGTVDYGATLDVDVDALAAASMAHRRATGMTE